jgi:ArsR family transcriptional regulator, arsenate/arsenite/antimonite-responsive transcriptional repressor
MQLDDPAQIVHIMRQTSGATALPSALCEDPLPASEMPKTTPTEAVGSTDLMFRAFSDRTRLRILHVLQGGELCVGDIVEILQSPQPRISRHLAYLRKANLVIVRKAGLWSHYSLAPAKTPFHRKLLECLAKCFGEVSELKCDLARAAKIGRSGGCCPTSQRIRDGSASFLTR